MDFEVYKESENQEGVKTWAVQSEPGRGGKARAGQGFVLTVSSPPRAAPAWQVAESG